MLHAMSILFMPCSRFLEQGGTSVLQHAFARTGGKLLPESLSETRKLRLNAGARGRIAGRVRIGFCSVSLARDRKSVV